MENKKTRTSTIFLTIAIILIIVLGALLYLQKIQTDGQIAELEDNNSKLQETINNLQEKLDNISNTITNDTTETSSNLNQDKYIEITSNLNDDDIFFITNANQNGDGTYTLKGVLYTKFTLTKSELEDAVKNGTYKYYNQYGTNPRYVNYKVKKDYIDQYSSKPDDYAFIGKFQGEERVNYIAVKKDDNTYYIQNTTEMKHEWKLTNNYRKITISGDIDVENEYDENYKAKTYFNDFKDKTAIEESHPSNCFTFVFENGKCSKMYEYITSH